MKYLQQFGSQDSLITKEIIYKIKTILTPLMKNQQQSLNMPSYQLMTWGSGKDGRLGHGDELSQKIPLSLGEGIKFAFVSCGYHHTVAVNGCGDVYSWGRGERGQLGLGDEISQFRPQKVPNLSNIVKVACGWQHTLALSASGEMYTWGFGEEGQLGNGECVNSNRPEHIFDHGSDIFAGHSHSAIQQGTNLYSFGNNCDGRCMNPELGIIDKPQLCFQGEIRSVSLGVSHCGVVTSNGEVYTAGLVGDGQLGVYLEDGDENTACMDEQLVCWYAMVERFGQKNRGVSIACGDMQTLILNDRGFVFECGKGVIEPTPKLGLQNIKKVEAGCRHVGCLSGEGQLYMWGFNFHNQLGMGDNDQDQIEAIKLLDGIKQVSMGFFHSVALKIN